MHNGDTGSYPTAPVGAVRLWDADVSWREIETAPGHYDFTRVDARVNAARAHGATVLLVLGQTARAAVNLLGSERVLRGGERIGVSASPVMVRSAR
jgi:hypothetical protein